mgnify:CR=1 FL=1
MSIEPLKNEELVKLIQNGTNVTENMQQLWQQNQGFIFKIAIQYQSLSELVDLIQESYFGLCKAVDHYNPDMDASFIHYASFWIRQQLIRYIKKNKTVRIPEHTHGKIREYKKAVQQWQQRYHREPTEAEISDYIGIDGKTLEEIKRSALMGKIGSLDVPVGEESDGTLYDLIPSGMDDKEEVLNKVVNEELAEVLWGMVEELPGQQSEVLKMRFKDNMKLREIGAVYGFSIDWARQIENKGLRTLRNPKRSRILREFLDDERIYNSALHGNGVSLFSNTWTSSTERIALKRIEADAEEASRRRAELREDYIRLWKKERGEPTEEDLEIIDQIVETDLRYELLHRGS